MDRNRLISAIAPGELMRSASGQSKRIPRFGPLFFIVFSVAILIVVIYFGWHFARRTRHLANLASNDPAVRSQAILQLDTAGFDFTQLLEHENPKLRAMACKKLGEVLGKLDHKTLVPLTKRLTDEDPNVRCHAALAIAVFGRVAQKPLKETEKSAIRQLCSALSDEHADVRSSLVYALGQFGRCSPMAISALKKSLHDSNRTVQIRAAWSLFRIDDQNWPLVQPVIKDFNSVPPLEECHFIAAEINGLELFFNSDGSGSTQAGAGDRYSAEFPKGSVDFAELYSTLLPSLIPESQNDKSHPEKVCNVVFRRSPGYRLISTDTSYRVHLKEKAVIDFIHTAVLDAVDPIFTNGLEAFMLLKQSSSEPFPKRQIAQHSAPNEQIVMFISGWKLTMNSDGSGALSVGRDASLTVEFGKQTFDYFQTHTTLFKKPFRKDALGYEPVDLRLIVVAVKPPTERLMMVSYSEFEPHALEELFDHAWKSAALIKKSPAMKDRLKKGSPIARLKKSK